MLLSLSPMTMLKLNLFLIKIIFFAYIIMVYRSQYRRRRIRRRRVPRKPRITYGMVGSKVYRDLMWLKRKVSLLNVEVKHYDVTAASTINTVGAAVAFGQVSAIAQGDTENTRDGNSIKAISLHAKLNVLQDPTTPKNGRIRFVLLKQGYNDAYTPTYADVFNDASIDAYRNIEESSGYKVLYDKTLSLDLLKNDRAFTQFSCPLSHHIKWDGANAADTTNGHIWYLVVCEAAANQPTFDLQTRLRYVDN